MSDIGSKIKYFFGLESTEDEQRSVVIEDEKPRERVEPRPTPRETSPYTQTTSERPKYRPSRSASTTTQRSEIPTPAPTNTKMVICKYAPVDYRESTSMIDDIRKGHPVIINFENTEDFMAAKIVNICEGAAYALDADISKIANAIFIIAPQGINLLSNSAQQKQANSEDNHR